ncbi:MAG: nucleotidyltransferase domain-containing protein [Prevotella sp.]|nr:nucleotidyltransferase domain-containing protein [Prevotella sp.]MCM1475021.1 nucleotidyltransferase domain-containing protein [Muribaculaceae bacterium]
MHIITENIHKLFALCRKYKVHKLYAFGSILTNRFNKDSDNDILVNFNSDIYYSNYSDNFIDFYNALKALFCREVDLVDETSVKNP